MKKFVFITLILITSTSFVLAELECIVITDKEDDLYRSASCMRYKAAVEGGRIYGFEVSFSDRCDKSEFLGIQNGDIAIEVNGVKIDTPIILRDLYNNIHSNYVKIKVLRSDKIIHIRRKVCIKDTDYKGSIC